MTVSVSQSAVVTTTSWTRWIQLGLGFVAMMSISSPQYVWTLFTKPFQDQLGVPLSAIQITFSILIVLQTWLSPLQGFLVDKFGLYYEFVGAFPDLRAVVRHRDRDRLYRGHRRDGALVS